MEGSSFRQESHIAQQSRREKLRIVEQSSTTAPSLLDNNNYVFYEQISVHSGLNPDLVAVRNIRNGDLIPRYGPNSSSSSVFNSEMLNFAANNSVLGDEKNAILDQELGLVQPNRGFLSTNMSNPTIKASSSSSSSNWRTIDSQHSYEWMVNNNASRSRESNQKTVFVGDVLSNNAARVHNLSRNVGFDQGCNLSTCQDCPKQPQQQFTSHSHYYQNATIQDVLAAQPSALFLENANNSWSNAGCGGVVGDQLGLIPTKTEQEGLSLTLSSNPLPPDRANVNQFGDSNVNQDSRSYLCTMSKPEIMINRACGSGKSINDSSNYDLRNVGPLGPFTGYATILKSSTFLKPAQQLLEEFCAMTGSNKLVTTSGEAGILGCVDVVNAADNPQISPHKLNHSKTNNNNNNNDYVVSSSAVYSSNNECGDVGIASSSCESYRPEYQQKKAKLLYLQEEVYRRYKQYHQQMQMVSSSFESVAGLSSATPYVCLALRSVSRNFKCLKQAISDQLRHITKALGEDLVSPNTGASSSKGDTMTSRFRYTDQSFQRHKTSGANMGCYEPQQHVWRPQRGLPERSVAVLRAWLFDHFLHPYPTDADKHMLAAQTGLSRNQVSNWFINARVRVWKPMVEDMHTLEMKGVVVEGNDVEEKCGGEGSSSRGEQQPMNIVATNCGEGSSVKVEPWNQEKRSRVEFQVPMNFLPYQTSGIEVGGMGAVSLTLGLRHGVENAQHHHHQHQNQLRRQFGGQIIHDFVG